jgi:hypothetical protein
MVKSALFNHNTSQPILDIRKKYKKQERNLQKGAILLQNLSTYVKIIIFKY